MQIAQNRISRQMVTTFPLVLQINYLSDFRWIFVEISLVSAVCGPAMNYHPSV